MLAYKSTDIPIEDLRLYFGGTLVRVHEGNKAPRWLSFQEAKSGGLYFNSDSQPGQLLVMKRCPEVLLEQCFPIGFFNTKDSVVFGYRIPVRESRKGINRGNYNLQTIESILNQNGLFKVDSMVLKAQLQALSQKRVAFSTELFELLFEKSKYYTISEAYVAIKGKKAFSRALSPNFALVPHPHNKDFLVLRHEYPVAELVSKNKIKILMEEFRQECLNFFPNQGATVI